MIKIRNLSFQYPDGTQILDNFNLTVQENDRIALIGPNGTGKTTLFKIIMGLLIPQEGEVIIFGKQRKEEEDFVEVREKIGFLFQDSDDQLFCSTVEEDIAFGPLNLGKSKEKAMEIVSETLELVDMQGFEKKTPYSLSGGEKRMIAFATILAMKPKLLLLDEPFAGLDKDATEKMLSILTEIDLPYVIISHRNSLVKEVTDDSYYLNR
ncbi:ABC transporter related protein [Acetohalobium arabaticum DSM 5501]|uniref:ABC transporter related protein n=2 Tax=Acetohalobium TaxID=28186 RepID=D9QVR0_ACEAZ|nr:ABC transporter related protein [Acetohalobium arabaticum DSM 5501]